MKFLRCTILAAFMLPMLNCAQVDETRYQRTNRDPVYGQSDGLFYDNTTSGFVLVANGSVINRWDSSGNPSELVPSEAEGDILIRGASTWERLAAGTSGQVLVGDGTDLASVAVSGDATMAAGGALTVTDVTVGSDATGDMQYKSSATALARLAIGAAGQFIQTNAGATAPQWSSFSGDVSVATGGAVTATHEASWSFVTGAAIGEDSDGAATNGGGMVGGQAVDVTTHDYNSAGAGAGDVHCKVYDAGDDTWDELATSSSLTGWTNNYQLLPDAASEATSDAFAVGFANQFVEVVFNDLATNNGTLATWGGAGGKWQYSTGAGTWSDLTVFDNTDSVDQTGGQPLVRTGAITFAPAADWVVATYDGQEAYWVQYVLTATQLTQTPIIDDTNFDEPIVGIPDTHTFFAPEGGSITAIRVVNLHDTVHDQVVKFTLGAFTPTAPTGFSHSAQQTWTASQPQMRFDLSARPVVVAAGQRMGIMVQEDTASTTNPVWAVDMTVTLQ